MTAASKLAVPLAPLLPHMELDAAGKHLIEGRGCAGRCRLIGAQRNGAAG